MIRIFISCAREDSGFLERLEEHLSALKRQRLVTTWHTRQLSGGSEWAREIDENLKVADLILLLISPAFVASDYCWDIEMQRALELQAEGRTEVVPVLLKPVDIEGAPFTKLSTLPRSGQPIGASENRDKAFLSVVQELRATVMSLPARRADERALPTGIAVLGQLRLRTSSSPQLPEDPYPLLLPYNHPALLAGRDQDLANLRRILTGSVPLVGLYASSGVGKSSLLKGGLLPILREDGYPVALVSHPSEPRLAHRLLVQMVENPLAPMPIDLDWKEFSEILAEVRRLAGLPPILIIDQLDDTFRRSGNDAAKATLGCLLAATVKRIPGAQDPVCRWLLAYRQEVHGEFLVWLRDVLADAKAQGVSGIEKLPTDLSAPDRLNAYPLEPVGTAKRGTDPLVGSTEAFRDVLKGPLRVRTACGKPFYRVTFSGEGVERLASAFARARQKKPEAALVPELQVVLGFLMKGGEEVIEVPDDVEDLIDGALESHIRRTLIRSFPIAGRSGRLGRTRALIALRELAQIDRGLGRPVSEEKLKRAIGDNSGEVLEHLESPRSRLIVSRLVEGEGLCFQLSHYRMSEAVLRLVEEEGALARTFDAQLLRINRVVGLEAASHDPGKPIVTRLSRSFQKYIEENIEVILSDEARRAWWRAFQKARKRRRLRYWGLGGTLFLLLALLMGITKERSARLVEERGLLSDVEAGEAEAAFAALARLLRDGKNSQHSLLELVRRRGKPSQLLSRGLMGVPEAERSAAVRAVASLLLPLVEQEKEDLERLANIVWAVDYAPGREPQHAEAARRLRESLLQPLRQIRPVPQAFRQAGSEWATIPEGTFEMGGTDGRSIHISSFCMLRHEVTNEDYRHLAPHHEGGAALPAAMVSWHEAYSYAAWLGGRLPTEAEWEYSARARCNFDYCDRRGQKATAREVAWTLLNSLDQKVGELVISPVMQLEPNRWQLFDMLGSVFEWTADWYGEYPSEAEANPWGREGPDIREAWRVARGGDFRGPTEWAQMSYRARISPANKNEGLGFRVVLPCEICCDPSPQTGAPG